MKSILITGASTGIGRCTAELFLKDGWRVGVIARRRALLEEIAANYDNAVVLAGDVTDHAAMQSAFAEFIKKAGHLDAVFNNAGAFGPSGSIDEISLDAWEKVLDVNLRGMFITARLAFAQMRAQDPQGGRVINNGSLSAYVPRPGSVCYTTTKHAITGLTKTLSLDGRPYNIACCQIDIGNAKTELVEELNARALAADPNGQLMPMMQVEDAARSVLHMANMPTGANVQFMTVMATNMPYIGRG